MAVTTLPTYNMDNAETGCCPRFDPSGWDGAEVTFQDRLFVRTTTRNIMHIPLGMGKMFVRTLGQIEQAGAGYDDHYLTLSTDPSPWRGEHYFDVTKDVPGAEMARLAGLVSAGTVTRRAAKDVLARMVEKGGDPEELVKTMGLARVSDEDELQAWRRSRQRLGVVGAGT